MYSAEVAEILKQLKLVLSYQLCLPLDAVAASATLEGDLSMDRLDFAEMCIALEEAFDVEIDEMLNFRTVSDVAAFLGRRVLPSVRYADEIAMKRCSV
jgi:acyl carrier protein